MYSLNSEFCIVFICFNNFLTIFGICPTIFLIYFYFRFQKNSVGDFFCNASLASQHFPKVEQTKTFIQKIFTIKAFFFTKDKNFKSVQETKKKKSLVCNKFLYQI